MNGKKMVNFNLSYKFFYVILLCLFSVMNYLDKQICKNIMCKVICVALRSRTGNNLFML